MLEEIERMPASLDAERRLLATVGTRRAVRNAWSAARRIVELIMEVDAVRGWNRVELWLGRGPARYRARQGRMSNDGV